MGYYSAIAKDEILLFAAIWVDLETVMLTEIIQSEQEPYDFTHTWDIKLKLIDTDKGMVVTREKRE